MITDRDRLFNNLLISFAEGQNTRRGRLWRFDDPVPPPPEEKKLSTLQRVGRFAKKNWLPIAGVTAGTLAIGAGIKKYGPAAVKRVSEGVHSTIKTVSDTLAKEAPAVHTYLPTKETKQFAQSNYGKPGKSEEYYAGVRDRNVRNKNNVITNKTEDDDHYDNFRRLNNRRNKIKYAIEATTGHGAKKDSLGMHLVRALIKHNKLQESLVRIIALADTMMQGTSAIGDFSGPGKYYGVGVVQQKNKVNRDPALRRQRDLDNQLAGKVEKMPGAGGPNDPSMREKAAELRRQNTFSN